MPKATVRRKIWQLLQQELIARPNVGEKLYNNNNNNSSIKIMIVTIITRSDCRSQWGRKVQDPVEEQTRQRSEVSRYFEAVLVMLIFNVWPFGIWAMLFGNIWPFDIGGVILVEIFALMHFFLSADDLCWGFSARSIQVFDKVVLYFLKFDWIFCQNWQKTMTFSFLLLALVWYIKLTVWIKAYNSKIHFGCQFDLSLKFQFKQTLKI